MKYLDRIGAYLYYRRGGKRWRLHGEPGSNRFLRDYQEAAAGFGEAGPFGVPDLFAGVISAYLTSPEFKDLAQSTRDNYRMYLKQLRPVFGPSSIHDIKRRHVKAYRDSIADRRGKANQSVAVMLSVMAWAIDADLIEVNPALGIKRLKGEERKPWPQPLIERFMAEAPNHLVWAVAMGLWTGQRRGNVLGAKWADIEGGAIHFPGQKKGEEVWTPILPALDAVLSTIPRRSLHILTNRQGEVWKPVGFSQELRKFMRGIDAGEYVFHGLRKNFLIVAAEASGTAAELKSWSGHKSDSMVEHYIRRADRKRLATSLRDKVLNAKFKSVTN